MANKIDLVDNEMISLFLQHLLHVDTENPYSIEITNASFICPNDVLSSMIKRLLDGKITVLPFKQQRDINWLILSKGERDLIKGYDELKHFLSPYHVSGFTKTINLFNPNKTKLGKLGNRLFPYGYYGFKSSLEKEDIIWENLSLWNKLDERRPEVAYDELEITAFSFRNKFQQAISLQNWSEAKGILLELQQGHYINDENLKFLYLQFLSAQFKWQQIWESNDYELISGLEKIPRKVQFTLLNAFYQCVLIQTDQEKAYHSSFENYQQFRFRLGTLIRNQLGLDEEETIRIFAYEAAIKKQEEKLQRYLDKTEDPTTKEIIQYLINHVIEGGQVPPTVPNITKEEEAVYHYQQQEFEDAYILLMDSPHSLTKVKLLTGIAVMHETEETCTTAFEEYQKLTEQEKKQLLTEPTTKAQIKYILNWNEEKSSLLQAIDEADYFEIHTWNDWFEALIENKNLHNLDQILHDMDIQQDNINWTLSMLSRLSEQLTELSIADISASQKTLIQTALPMFINELLQDRHFPNSRANEVYDYVSETILIYCKKNEGNTKFLLRLIDGLLILDITRINDYWKRIRDWFNVHPTIRLSNYVLESLEIFVDYGLDKGQLKEVWVNWTNVLLEQFTKVHTTQIESWLEVGNAISADSYLLNQLESKIDTDREEDSLSLLSPMTITIFSLREKPARRASLRIMTRNSNIKVKVCTDDRLTTEAKTYARSSDLVLLVTTCMSHALTYGISPFLRDNVIYARSSGETGIVEALEEYAETNNPETEAS